MKPTKLSKLTHNELCDLELKTKDLTEKKGATSGRVALLTRIFYEFNRRSLREPIQ